MSNEDRIKLAASCRDADAIPKHADAGAVIDSDGRRVQIMHNGVKVLADQYYGSWMTELVRHLRGHHEPQEESVFHAVLQALGPRPTMVELGGYWCYYSLWLKSVFPDARVIVVEPIGERLAVGRANFALNTYDATILEAAVSDGPDEKQSEFKTGAEASKVPRVSVDSLAKDFALQHIDILHIDIQGWERRALLGSSELLSTGRIGWVFVSTHRWLEEGQTMDLHIESRRILDGHGYVIVAEHTPEQSFTVDGLIVAKSPTAPGPDRIPVSHLGAVD
ncbi:FkbM family methyltransferase [Hyphomicrobium sp.]|uniref:FkbM family methyltransferase n=1 Tax=Hyphomicrobium sp. TaxID=82 RepID=UPI0025C11493|nr:FkbM family methyltransferase [Hyphomicrobium sp.]MCC7253466.1 FkbM family methyltransferase [Hyphomicrobium sp.]